ncbi:MAG: hypothetical protein CM1200mP15_08940 [Dehalococcoidia bacterium]|nr:MAG: hypothetical protein CM1200mP15_08940 [Dehalococcoidia bacterium]
MKLRASRQGRLFILDKMSSASPHPENNLANTLPRWYDANCCREDRRSNRTRGAFIKSIIEETGCSVDVTDDGKVTIGSSDQEMISLAQSKVEALTRELVVGDIITGKVGRTTDFGAFIELLPGKMVF